MTAISWNLQMTINEGRLGDFRALMEEMVAATTNEPGAQTYDWYVSSDGSTAHINERYADSAAAMVHLGNFGANYAERFMSMVQPTAFAVYGPASSELREALAGFAPAFLDFFGGFRR